MCSLYFRQFAISCREGHESRKLLWARSNSKAQLHSPTSAQGFDIASASWRMESIVRDDSDSSCDEEDEFFDCQGKWCNDNNFVKYSQYCSWQWIVNNQSTFAKINTSKLNHLIKVFLKQWTKNSTKLI